MKKKSVQYHRSSIHINDENSRAGGQSKSRSPVRVLNGIKLYNFSELDSYKKISRPHLSSQKSQIIKTKLDLQKNAWVITKERTKQNNEFVNYNFNPFIVQNNTKIEANQPMRKISLVEGLNDLKQKNINRQKSFKALTKIKEGANKFSDFIQKQSIVKPQHSKSVMNLQCQPPKHTTSVQIEPVFLRGRKKSVNYAFFNDQKSFDQITKIQQKNWFNQQYESINLFRVLFHKDEYLKKKSKLEQYRFNFISLVQKNQKIKIPVYRDLSRQARMMVSKRPAENLLNSQQFHNDIQFYELMNVSAGRYTAEFIYQQLHAKQNRFEEQNQFGQFKFSMKNKAHKSTITQNNEQQQIQIQEFKKYPLTKFERRNQKIFQNRKLQLKQNLKQQDFLISSTINDQTVHKNLHKNIEENIQGFMENMKKYPEQIKERNKYINQNKQQKTRVEVLRLKKMLESFFLKKNHDNKMANLIGRRM